MKTIVWAGWIAVALALPTAACAGGDAAPSWEARVRALGVAARTAIEKGDGDAMLRLIDSAGVACGDGGATKADLGEQFAKKQGPDYATLFDTPMLKKFFREHGMSDTGHLSFRDYFRQGPDAVLTVKGGEGAGIIGWESRTLGSSVQAPSLEYYLVEGGRYVIIAIDCG